MLTSRKILVIDAGSDDCVPRIKEITTIRDLATLVSGTISHAEVRIFLEEISTSINVIKYIHDMLPESVRENILYAYYSTIIGDRVEAINLNNQYQVKQICESIAKGKAMLFNRVKITKDLGPLYTGLKAAKAAYTKEIAAKAQEKKKRAERKRKKDIEKARKLLTEVNKRQER